MENCLSGNNLPDAKSRSNKADNYKEEYNIDEK